MAFDVGPLAGPRTGIGNAVDHLHSALSARDDVRLIDYLISYRASGGRASKLPIPALVAHRLWQVAGHPRADRWLDPFDLIHGTNYVVPPSIEPRLVSVYDCWFLQQPQLASASVRRSGRVLLRSLAQGAHAHVSSQATAETLAHFAPQATIHVGYLGALPLPAPSEDVALPELVGRPYVLAIGTIERRKNLPHLVRSFGIVANLLPDLHLVLAGTPSDDSIQVRAAIDQLGPSLSHRVLMTGRISESARGWLIRHATAVAYPSLDEGFGFPLLDAMQAGVPIVASTAGSIPEIAGDAAVLVDPADQNQLAEAMSSVVVDDALRARLIDAGSQRWTQFGWAESAEQMANIYRCVMNGVGS